MCIVFLLRIYEWVLGRGEGFQPVPQFTECDHIPKGYSTFVLESQMRKKDVQKNTLLFYGLSL
jgi:hypothetical protein